MATEAEGQPLAEATLVLPDGTARQHYELVHLRFQSGGEARCVNLVLIAQVAQGGWLVAAPEAVWSRVAADRKMPRGALSQAILVEVLTASIENPEVPLDSQRMNLWVGRLDPRLVSRLQIGGGENPTFDVWVAAEEEVFGEEHMTTLIPYGPALAEVAEEHFAFASAASDLGVEAQPLEASEATQVPLSDRLDKVEEAVLQMRELLENSLLQRPTPPAERKSALKRPQTPSQPVDVQAARNPLHVRGLDPAVVASALEAGIPESQLVTLGGLLRKTSKMDDVPARKPSGNVLSESEGEDDDVELLPDATPGEPAAAADASVAKAVVQLTKIVGSLAAQKSKGKDLESMLDCAEGGGESSSSSGSSRSKAAAFKKLRAALTEAPEKLSKVIEEAIDEDFLQVKNSPGVSAQDFSTRAWVEHRSKLQHYPQTIRMAWILAGAHDAMRQKKFEEAKARILLGLVALDQASLDAGSWALAQEVLLEPPAPFHSFVGRKLPEAWEQTTSKLLDDRVADVLREERNRKQRAKEEEKGLRRRSHQWQIERSSRAGGAAGSSAW